VRVRALFVLLLVSACMTPLVLTPETGPGTPYPCGVGGHSCGGHLCCSEDFICGGTPYSGCPATLCCFVGQERRAPDAGPVPNASQRPE
jgi:hypothetical protein